MYADDAWGFNLPDASTDNPFVCVEETTIYDNMPAYRFKVEGTPGVYIVENGFEDRGVAVFDNTAYEVLPGEYVRAHKLEDGDEFVTDQVTGDIAVGTAYGVLATGMIG